MTTTTLSADDEVLEYPEHWAYDPLNIFYRYQTNIYDRIISPFYEGNGFTTCHFFEPKARGPQSLYRTWRAVCKYKTVQSIKNHCSCDLYGVTIKLIQIVERHDEILKEKRSTTGTSAANTEEPAAVTNLRRVIKRLKRWHQQQQAQIGGGGGGGGRNRVSLSPTTDDGGNNAAAAATSNPNKRKRDDDDESNGAVNPTLPEEIPIMNDLWKDDVVTVRCALWQLDDLFTKRSPDERKVLLDKMGPSHLPGAILHVIKKFPNDLLVMTRALSAIANIFSFPSPAVARDYFRDMKGLEFFVGKMKQFSSHDSLLASGCIALHNLLRSNEASRKYLKYLNCLPLVVKAMKANLHSSETQTCSCRLLLWSGLPGKEIFDADVVPLAYQAMKQHPSNEALHGSAKELIKKATGQS